jgi:hypothetical protein
MKKHDFFLSNDSGSVVFNYYSRRLSFSIYVIFLNFSTEMCLNSKILLVVASGSVMSGEQKLSFANLIFCCRPHKKVPPLTLSCLNK